MFRFCSPRVWRQGSCCWLLLTGCLAAPLHADPLKSVAKTLAKGTQTLKSKHIAVLLFPYENGYLSSGSSIVSENLVTLLAQRSGIQVVERSLLGNVLGEIRVEESGVTPSSGAAQTGQILNVDAVVTGTLSDNAHDETVVNARLIQLPTGEILAAASTTIDRTWDDLPKPVMHLAEDTDDNGANDPNFQNSGYIYTPWARGAGSVSSVLPASERPAAPVGITASVPSAPVAPSVVVLGGPLYRTAPPVHHPALYRNNPGRTQLLYALGVTLDAQGHNHQAERYYRQIVAQSPPANPYRAQAQVRLGMKSQ